jgi:Oxysterol-binding protein
VSHHPPITAFHCESATYEVFSCQTTTARFNGRYIQLAPKNRVYINLKLSDGSSEQYSWNIPPTYVHNLLIGKMYVEVRGKTTITNHTTGDTCEMDWKERGWSGKNANMVEGLVKSNTGQPKYRMHSRFTEYGII